MNNNGNARREDARREALHFLVIRSGLKHAAPAIRRGVNHEGFDFSQTEISAALTELETGGYVTKIFSMLGESTFFQATLKGCLLIEQGL